MAIIFRCKEKTCPETELIIKTKSYTDKTVINPFTKEDSKRIMEFLGSHNLSGSWRKALPEKQMKIWTKDRNLVRIQCRCGRFGEVALNCCAEPLDIVMDFTEEEAMKK